MIEIRLNDNAFEQDIRELLMAFFPGESFSYQQDPECRLGVEGEKNEDGTAWSLRLFGPDARDDLRPEGFLPVPELAWEIEHRAEPVQAVPESRTETKNRLKRRMYALLVCCTGRELPWGSLTGIRPVKIALTRLEEGMGREEIAAYMKRNYFASDEKIRLSVETALREQRLLSGLDYENGYSLYVGIPFCPTTCLYCSFTSYPIGKWEKRMDEYLGALFRELEYTADRMKGKVLDTVYFGGGTPTSLSAEHLDQVIAKVEELFDLSGVQEFTVEAGRPDSITREKLEVLKRHGITRISINPQTMNQKTLDVIGRRHTVDMVKEKFALAREMGFDNINMDLIIGLPGERMEDVAHTLEEVRRLSPDSLTVHSLALKRAARLNLEWDQYADMGMVNTQEMIDLTARFAREMGMEPYYLYRQKNMAGNFENVGYSLPGKACIYNILIMEEMQTIAACGAGTTTKVVFPQENRRERTENVKDVDQYIQRIDEMIERKEKLLSQIV